MIKKLDITDENYPFGSFKLAEKINEIIDAVNPPEELIRVIESSDGIVTASRNKRGDKL